MSFDPNQNNPAMGAPAKSGSGKKWLFVGLGCFGVLTLLCIAGVVALFVWAPSFFEGIVLNSGYESARTSIETDEAVGDAVGRPVVVGQFDPSEFSQKAQGEKVEYTYGLTVEGSEKSGTATVVVSGNPIKGDWTVDSIEVDVEGEKIVVGELDLDITEEDVGDEVTEENNN